jgi:hypothetical protein
MVYVSAYKFGPKAVIRVLKLSTHSHPLNLTLNEVDCQKASMMGAHSSGDLVDVNTHISYP